MGKKNDFSEISACLRPKIQHGDHFLSENHKIAYFGKTIIFRFYLTTHSQNRIKCIAFQKKKIENRPNGSGVTVCLRSKKVTLGHFFNFRGGPTSKPVKIVQNRKKVYFSTFLRRF